jgi:hypothetical protein
MSLASFNTFTFFVSISNNKSISAEWFCVIIVANNTNPTKLDDGTDGFGGASIGILKGGTNGYVGNHIFAIEIDTFQITVINDPSASHVGLDINCLISIQACDICLFFSPSYFDSGETFAISIDYTKKQ